MAGRTTGIWGVRIDEGKLSHMSEVAELNDHDDLNVRVS